MSGQVVGESELVAAARGIDWTQGTAPLADAADARERAPER